MRQHNAQQRFFYDNVQLNRRATRKIKKYTGKIIDDGYIMFLKTWQQNIQLIVCAPDSNNNHIENNFNWCDSMWPYCASEQQQSNYWLSTLIACDAYRDKSAYEYIMYVQMACALSYNKWNWQILIRSTLNVLYTRVCWLHSVHQNISSSNE